MIFPFSRNFRLFLIQVVFIGTLLLAAAGKTQSLSLPPLHVEGPFLKDPSGHTVILRGVNHHGFLDVPDGAWDPSGAPLYSGMGHWNPEVVQQTLQGYHQLGFNVLRFHTVVDWWRTNPQTYEDQYRKVTYSETYRKMIRDTVKWAGERGLYVIFDFYALKNTAGRQSGQESLPWSPWSRFPGLVKDRQEFEKIWVSVFQELGNFPNVLFELYNEPHGDAKAKEEWFKFVTEVLPKMRLVTKNPVIVQWDYMCWVNLDYPPPGHPASTLDWIERHPLKDSNLVYGTHLYRNSGNGGPGTAHRSGPPLVNLWQRDDMEKALKMALAPWLSGERPKPLLVTEIGAFLSKGGEDKEDELAFLKNTLGLLNQWNIGYVGWGWASDAQIDHGMLHDGKPNEAGKTFLDSLIKRELKPFISWKRKSLMKNIIPPLPLVFIFFLFGCSGATVKKSATASPVATPTVPQAKDFHPLREGQLGTVRLAFVGDVMVARRMEKLLDEKGTKWAFEACKPMLDDSDLAVANLESPVGRGGEKYTRKSVYFKGRVDLLDALSYGGFGLVTLSNNHILDYGPDVTDQTLKALDERGILHVGLKNPGDPVDRAVYVKVRDVNLAFLSYCSVCPEKFTATWKRPGIRVALPEIMAPELRLAKSKADFVIVLVHWGLEHQGNNKLQKRLAWALSDEGADLVIGAHPHVLQKIQRVGKEGKTLVAYSLGNFLFDMKCRGCNDSCILKVDLKKGKRIHARFVPVTGDSGRPEPVDSETDRAQKIKNIFKKGYKHGKVTWEKCFALDGWC